MGTRHRLEHSDEFLVNVHDPGRCIGEHCTIHAMSDHLMRAFPQHWRADRHFMERVCPHGIGHPDPDDPKASDRWESIHGCDGCCRHATDCAYLGWPTMPCDCAQTRA